MLRMASKNKRRWFNIKKPSLAWKEMKRSQKKLSAPLI
jgi:hypothetical protein